MFKSNKSKEILYSLTSLLWVILALTNTTPDRFDYVVAVSLLSITNLIYAFTYLKLK